MIEVLYAVPWWIYFTITLVIVVVIPKRFLRLSKEVEQAVRYNRVKGSVVRGLCGKFEWRGRGFGENEEYMFWNEKMPNGEIRVWQGWANNGVMTDVELYSTIGTDGTIRRSSSASSDGYEQ